MITHKDYFSGFCGKTKKLGNPIMYTTPTTAQIYPDYSFSVKSGQNIKGSLEACSLDGRLWLFRRSRRLAVIGCNFGGDKLSIASSQNFNNNDDVILARGLNWILTNKHIFMVNDYGTVSYAKLFDDNIPDLFLYSALRRMTLDPFTNQPWGESEDNGNSEGKGFFSKDTHLLYPPNSHSFEQCYSLLPEVGDWIIFENFLIRKPDHALSDSYHYMKNIRPLIPLELHHAGKCVPAFGTGYNLDNRGIQVAVLDGQLWGRGLHHVGKVYLIAAGFDKDSEPQEYYLYISPDFPNLNPDPSTQNDWLNVAIAPIGTDNICAYYSDENDPIHGGTCMRSTNSDILNTSGDECVWETLSEDDTSGDDNSGDDTSGDDTSGDDTSGDDNSGDDTSGDDTSGDDTSGEDTSGDDTSGENKARIFFDYSSATALMLDDNGATVFSESIDNPTTYHCSTLRQWIDPADSIEAVPDWGVLSKDDLALFFTEFQRGFHRSRLCSGQTLPLSAMSYALKDNSNVRLSVNVTSSSSEAPNFQVKHSCSQAVNLNPLDWNTVFRQPVTLHYIGNFNVNNVLDDASTFYFHKDDFIVNRRVQYNDRISDYRDYFISIYGEHYSCVGAPVLCSRIDYFDKASYRMPGDTYTSIMVYYRDSRYGWIAHYYYHKVEMDLILLNLEQLSSQKITLTHSTTEPIIGADVGLSHDNFVVEYSYLEDKRYYNEPNYGPQVWLTADKGSVPSYIKRYCNEYDILDSLDYHYMSEAKLQSLVAPSLRLSHIFSDENNPEVSYAVFYSAFSNIPFTIEIQEKGVNATECYTYPDTSDYFTLKDGTKVAKSNLHMAIVNIVNDDYTVNTKIIYSFKSEFDNTKFDFIADYERSKPA